MDLEASDNFDVNKDQMSSTLNSVLSLFDKMPGLTDFLANRLLDIADSIPVHKNIVDSFNNNPMSDSVIYDYKNYPKELYKSP